MLGLPGVCVERWERGRHWPVTKHMPRFWHLSGVQVLLLVPVNPLGRTGDRVIDIWL